MTKTSAEYQRDYIAAQKAKGLKRIVLWVQPEDVDLFQTAARNPQALNRLRRRIRAEIEPGIREKVEAELTRKTQRAILAQKRAQVRRQQAGSNRPPELIRFAKRPPWAVRQRLKKFDWVYDIERAVWILPDDPDAWSDTERLLKEFECYDIQRLVEPLD